jgi:Holliday junction resolvasome RuvABC endonuclease subunit
MLLAAPTLVVYEDYAMGARGNNMFNIGELGGVLKTLIWEKGVDLLSVPPTTMKSVIAFNGRAEKADITKALRTRFGLSVNQHDEADATGLMIVGEILKGIRRVVDEAGKTKRSDAIYQLTVTKGQLQSISFSTS